MKYILLLAAIVFLLSGCRDENRDRNVGTADYEIQAEGCTVKYIDNPKGYNFFIAKCPAESETITTKRPKSNPEATVITSTDLRKQLAEVEAKEKALSKLTVQEKVLLGIKE